MSALLAFGRYGILPLLILGAFFHARRIYQNNKRVGIRVIVKMLSGLLLILASALTALVIPTIWWVTWLGTTCIHFGLLMSYYAIDQYINDKIDQDILRDKAFQFLVILSIIRIFFEYYRRDNLASFMDNQNPEPTLNMYLSNLLHYLPGLYFDAKITRIYWKNIREAKISPAYILRRIFCMIGFMIATFAFICLTASVLLAMFVTDAYRPYLNAVYHFGKPILMLFLLIGLTAPNGFFNVVVRPFERYLIRRQEWQHKHITYLMNIYNQIIPMQRYQPSIPRPEGYKMPLKRINATIGDGRLLLLSHKQLRSLDPKKEAQYLFELSSSNRIIKGPGDHDVPPAPKDPVAYNVQVARHLLKLQGNNQSIAFDGATQ